jgi:hypothetical protein
MESIADDVINRLYRDKCTGMRSVVWCSSQLKPEIGDGLRARSPL